MTKRSKQILGAVLVLLVVWIGYSAISFNSDVSNFENEDSSGDSFSEAEWMEKYKEWSECMDLAYDQNYPNPKAECASLEP